MTGRLGQLAQPRRVVVVGVALTVAVVVLAGLTLALAARPGALGARDLVGRAAPPLSGTTLTGDHYRMPARPGHLTVVNIWAAWCAPCRSEIPLLARAADDYRARGVRVVTIDTRDGPVAARSLLADARARSLLAVEDPRGRLAVSWGATGVPETVVVDRRGVVRARWLGAVSRSWLDRQVHRWS
jgi:cytochrome c biogenesis protein CcmG, thiol:disulfide interchange protein DsbE